MYQQTHWFYSPGDHDTNLKLDKSESHHCINVLRLKEKDIIQVINGKGTLSTAKIIFADPAGVELEILSSVKEFGKKEYYLHIGIAPPKNIARFEWFLEKSVEIGIDEITPIFTHRSERVNIRPDRLNKIILSAVKQSGKAYIPEFNKPINFKEFIINLKTPRRYIADCNADIKDHLLFIRENLSSVLIIIGPEGGFTSEEIVEASHNGFISVSLGQSLLRTETAGVVAAQIIADRMLLNKY